MRSYRELVSDDPAWPAIERAAKASVRVKILSREQAAAVACLERVQVTTRSTLGALAYQTGGLLIDGGWLRMFGCGHARLERSLGTWNDALGVPTGDFLLVADDVVGGSFAINGGALGEVVGNVYYFAPDSLAWEDTLLGHSAFVNWAFTGDLDGFYSTMRWPGWQDEVATIGGDQMLSMWPPLWTREGKDPAQSSRKAVPAAEIWGIEQELVGKLAKR